MRCMTKRADPVDFLAREAVDDLARASTPSIWTYPAFVLIFLVTTDYFQKRPAIIVSFAILNLAISCGERCWYISTRE